MARDAIIHKEIKWNLHSMQHDLHFNAKSWSHSSEMGKGMSASKMTNKNWGIDIEDACINFQDP